MKQVAYAIIITITIFMIIPIWGLINDPVAVLRSNLRVYLLFVIIPYSVAAILLVVSRKREKSK